MNCTVMCQSDKPKEKLMRKVPSYLDQRNRTVNSSRLSTEMYLSLKHGRKKVSVLDSVLTNGFSAVMVPL